MCGGSVPVDANNVENFDITISDSGIKENGEPIVAFENGKGFKLLKFPKPAPEVVEAAVEEAGEYFESSRGVLQEVLENAEEIDQVLVVWRDHSGVIHWTGNTEGPGDSILLMEKAKNFMVEESMEDDLEDEEDDEDFDDAIDDGDEVS